MLSARTRDSLNTQHNRFNLVRPRLALPVHGEVRHQEAHAKIALECGVKETANPRDGDVYSIQPSGLQRLSSIDVNYLASDGTDLTSISREELLAPSVRAAAIALITLRLDSANNAMASPHITIRAFKRDLKERADLLMEELPAEILRLLDTARGEEPLQDRPALRTFLTTELNAFATAAMGEKTAAMVHIKDHAVAERDRVGS